MTKSIFLWILSPFLLSNLQGTTYPAAADTVDSSPFPFVDIYHTRAQKFSHELHITLGLRHLPDTLIFNQPNVKNRDLEYAWRILLDMEDDGITDYEIAFTHHKNAEKPTQKGTIDQFCKAAVFRRLGLNHIRMDLKIRIRRTESQITFIVPDSELTRAFNKKSRLVYRTFYQNGHSVFSDQLPDA